MSRIGRPVACLAIGVLVLSTALPSAFDLPRHGDTFSPGFVGES